MNRITLLTDFGTRDGYVAAMKGVIAAILPNALIDDASHDIAPGDIPGAAFALTRYWSRYPAGTVHIVVVDPGVGSARRPMAAWCDDRFLVGPDNGVLSLALRAARRVEAVELNAPHLIEGASNTFHGRDIFAPAAAHLARGVPLTELGHGLADPAGLELPTPEGNEGEVINVDRFGNLITNFAGSAVGSRSVAVGRRHIGVLRRTYSDVAPGETVALINSDGLLEIAVNAGSAAQKLGVGRGARVTLIDDR